MIVTVKHTCQSPFCAGMKHYLPMVPVRLACSVGIIVDFIYNAIRM